MTDKTVSDKENKSNDEDADNVVQIKGSGAAKLTAKQLAFCDGVLRGMSQSDAYRAAYDAENMADASIWTEASKLFAHPVVAQRIKALQTRQSDAALLSGLATRQHIQRTLYGLTTDGDNDGAKLRACELLGKLSDVAAFTERVEQITDNRTPTELEEELKIALEKAIGM
jgi:hypothetical protein